jgi:hypothetical protein
MVGSNGEIFIQKLEYLLQNEGTTNNKEAT